jgi:hypothetical protein
MTSSLQGFSFFSRPSFLLSQHVTNPLKIAALNYTTFKKLLTVVVFKVLSLIMVLL